MTTSDSSLIEPSFEDAMAAIEAADELTEQKRLHWTCSLRTLAKFLDRPLSTIAARWSSVQLQVRQLHHARLGVAAKTLANHRSNARAALHWYRKEENLLQHGAPLTPEWTRFCEQIDKSTRNRMWHLVRHCSARGVKPSSVNGAIVDEYWRYRGETSARPTNTTARRFMVRAWNTCVDKLKQPKLRRLLEPPRKILAYPAWKELPIGLRREIDSYFATLARPHRSLNGKRIAACGPVTISTRRRELLAVIRMAVREGVPIETLTDLAALLHPDVVERVIEAYWKQNGPEPKTSTIDLGWKLLRMAREIDCLDQKSLERLDEMRAALEDRRRDGLTPKNLQLIRQVLTPGVWNDVVSLPNILMDQARGNNDHAPIKAAVAAQLAVAIGILTFAPVRLRNLANIELGKNLCKPGGLNTPYWLVFPDYDVKNRVDLNFKFDQQLTALIDEYVHDFRPALLRGANAPSLFPGEAGKPKNALLFSQQITARIKKQVGLRVTVHQFRHAAAAVYLKHRPGDYETVRRFLGHRDINTTTRFYIGLQTIHATEQFGNIVRQNLELATDSDL